MPPQIASRLRQLGSLFGKFTLFLAVIVILVGAGVVIGRYTQSAQPFRVIGWALAAFFFGGLVGISEILSRYRDEPILASTTVYGLFYLLLNGIISLAAFALLLRYSTQIFPAITDDLFLKAMIAGFGGMTVFRSKLFTFRSSDGKEYAIGPAIVLETVLKTIDHKIDRRRATERQAKVFIGMKDFGIFTDIANYIMASLNSFQNLTEDEKKEIKDVIDGYQQIDWPDKLKIMALGFAFLNIAGEENFDEVMKNAKEFFSPTS